MSAPGGYPPPEFPGEEPSEPGPVPEPQPGEPEVRRFARSGLPVGAAIGILAGVLALGLVLVFAFGHADSGGSSLVALPGEGVTGSTQSSGTASAHPSDGATAAASSTALSTASGAAGGNGASPDQATDSPGGGSAGSVFSVGECVDTSGSGTHFVVDQASCPDADYKIIYAFQNETGNVANDESQCYSINGDDDEFENGDATQGYTLYCLNSLTGNYSPRRASVNNCLDANGAYEVDCSSTKATWIVIGRLDATTNTRGCTKFGSYDYSYYYTAPPQYVLCVDRYHQ